MSAIGAPNIPINTQMQANMPAPSVQGTNQNIAAPNAEKPKAETINDSFSYSEAPLNVGILEGPDTYSKTPIADELQRRQLSSPKEKLPVQAAKADTSKKPTSGLNNSTSPPTGALASKKHKTSANLSALFSIGSLVLIFGMLVSKGVCKIIKHK